MCKVGIYLVCDYPNRDEFLKAVELCNSKGVGFLEIGIPFSDPTADGDVIEKASQKVLERENLNDFFESLKKVREIFKKKLYIMTYANIVFNGGIEEFAKKFDFVDGIILADVPFVESGRFKKVFKRYNTGFVHFATPESDFETIERIKKEANDFIYFVSVRGTTGSKFKLGDDAIKRLEFLKDSKQDVIIGFGIRDKKDISEACRYADGVVIGTAAVESIGKGEFGRFLDSIM
ncbi:tryptophan synthase subunit alpha [Hippea alviniae]|uniref:tryptophan synthase subunit alpha n=1 Tax=Hippea alviniae TaxID=1279027 RepID=UPI0003B40174|nr:tryptophan synthase subunit alpha [Hippea alviniae]